MIGLFLLMFGSYVRQTATSAVLSKKEDFDKTFTGGSTS